MHKIKITDSQLTEEFVVNKLKARQIAKKYGMAEGSISRRIKKLGIKPETYENYLGKKFGMLIVVSTGEYDKHSHLRFKCRCECGEDVIVLGYSLLTGNTKSCGCNSRKKGKLHGLYKGYEDISSSMWISLRRGAKNRGLCFEITMKDAWDKFLEQSRRCPLTGINLAFAKTRKTFKSTTASLDRIDSSKGYIKGNIQWVHKKIQQMKWNSNQLDFINWCCMVADKHRKEN